MRGVILEKFIISCFASNNTILIEPIYLGNIKNKKVKSNTKKINSDTKIKPALFSFRVDEVVYFDHGDIPSNKSNKNRLYIPNNSNYPAWDCIYDDGTRTAFFSISISKYWDGHDEKVKKSFIKGIQHLFYYFCIHYINKNKIKKLKIRK